MKILLKGYYGFGNLGDDVLMKVTWKIVRQKYPNAIISIYSNFNENLKSFDQSTGYNHYIFNILDNNVHLIDWTSIDNFDLVVDGGGGVYFDYLPGSVIKRILNGCIRSLGPKKLYIIDQVLRKLTGKKKHLEFKKRIGLGLGIGPYTTSSQLFYQHLVEIGSTDVFFVRDKTSVQLLSDYSFEGKTFLCSDLAFYVDHWLESTIKLNATRDYRDHVGIILLDWHEGNNKRFSEVKKFAKIITASGGKVTFFSFDENHDKAYIKEFQDDYNLVVWRPNRIALSDFLESLSSQDVIFSARAHGVIIGSLLGVPTVCIGTSKKLEEVSKMFQYSSSLIQEPVSTEKLISHLYKVKGSYTDIVGLLSEDIEHNKSLANEMLLKLNMYL